MLADTLRWYGHAGGRAPGAEPKEARLNWMCVWSRMGVSGEPIIRYLCAARFRLRTSSGVGASRYIPPKRLAEALGVQVTTRALLLFLAMLACSAMAVVAEEWRGLVVQPEHRCVPYNRQDYPYPPSVEDRIVAQMGGHVYEPYTGRTFDDTGQTDIEHIVATSEAHDSGLCAANMATRRAFARDILNLTLASPSVNRHQKRDHDAGEWLPQRNRCWFADRIVRVRQKYDLTIDRREAEVLEHILWGCVTVEMVFHESATEGIIITPTLTEPAQAVDALALWDDNGNGQITCAEARHHGIAPAPRTHPAYRFMRDGDGDGIVCE